MKKTYAIFVSPASLSCYGCGFSKLNFVTRLPDIFVPISSLSFLAYGISWFTTHGAPALPVLTLYVNSVKLRLVMGVYSFVFGWFRTKTRQFWSVPFVSQEKRKSYLLKVKRDVERDIKKQ